MKPEEGTVHERKIGDLRTLLVKVMTDSQTHGFQTVQDEMRGVRINLTHRCQIKVPRTRMRVPSMCSPTKADWRVFGVIEC